ncbi:SCO family protein [Nitrobacter sp. 62-13]|uniref:SCO family protein n=1 Tax=Nitrobacter sp. 62-13 TaxID=1895797 RepID=UPI000AD491DE|nr:SCO family protein [Nitrobacter sp. 62-13]
MKPLFAAIVVMVFALVIMTGARAELTRSELDGVSLAPPAGASAPLSLTFRDIDNKRVTLREVIGGRPSLLLFMDFMCRPICGPALAERVTTLFRSNAGNVHGLTDALGYRYRYDAAADQFAHPAGALVLTSDGRVSRSLASLALNPTDLRLALVEAGGGRIGTFTDRLSLLCYGFDAAHGVYTPAIARRLKVLAGLTVIGVLGSIAILEKRRRTTKGVG